MEKRAVKFNVTHEVVKGTKEEQELHMRQAVNAIIKIAEEEARRLNESSRDGKG